MERENEKIMERDGPVAQSGPYVIRKRIGSTLYEVCVHFSQTSSETLRDKILRLARNEILNNKDEHE